MNILKADMSALGLVFNMLSVVQTSSCHKHKSKRLVFVIYEIHFVVDFWEVWRFIHRNIMQNYKHLVYLEFTKILKLSPKITKKPSQLPL